MSADAEAAADDLLIRHLIGLHTQHDQAHDTTSRGKLANLRYARRDRLHDEYSYGRVISALAPGTLTEDKERNEWRTVIAGLFGFAHDEVEQHDSVSLGDALRTLYDTRGNESLERRFMALLNSDAENLPGHLRQAISLLKAERIGLDWHDLLKAVRSWDALGKPVHKAWTRHYYRARKKEDAGADTADETTEGE